MRQDGRAALSRRSVGGLARSSSASPMSLVRGGRERCSARHVELVPLPARLRNGLVGRPHSESTGPTSLGRKQARRHESSKGRKSRSSRNESRPMLAVSGVPSNEAHLFSKKKVIRHAHPWNECTVYIRDLYLVVPATGTLVCVACVLPRTTKLKAGSSGKLSRSTDTHVNGWRVRALHPASYQPAAVPCLKQPP